MSIAAFSTRIKKSIETSLYLTRKDGGYDSRKKLNADNHVMEINQQTLMDGFGISSDSARLLFKKLKPIVKKSTIPYTSPQKYNQVKRGVFSIVNAHSLVIIARSFSSLKVYLRTYIKSDEKLNNTSLSNFDIGHTVGFGLERKNAVAAARLHQATKSVISTLKLDNNTAGVNQVKAIEADFINAFKDAHATYNANFEKDISITKNVLKGNLSFIFTVPQSEEYNRLLSTLEKQILNDFKNYAFSGHASKSIIEATFEQTEDIFFGRKPKKYKSSTKISGKTKLPGKKPKKSKTVGYSPVKKLLRDRRGQFQSVVNLQNLLQPLVTARVKSDMDSAKYFKTRTGKFTHSVRMGIPTITANNAIDMPYTYKKDPYEAFEKDGTFHRIGREPSRIIERSIREVAIELVNKSFNLNIRGF